MVKRTQEGKNNKKTKIKKKFRWRKKVEYKKNKEGNMWFCVARVLYIKLILSMRHFATPLRTAHSPFLTRLSLSYSTLTFSFHSHFLIALSLFAFCAETLDTFHLLFRIQIFFSLYPAT